eukprot:jgi/Chlat1/2515/Chrsp175S02429
MEGQWAVRGEIKDVHAAFAELEDEERLAREYPFELDGFQKEAVVHMENGNSVFVAAHTSAGKTVVAEYALALATRHETRAVYTAPIKTISNQKFRDFSRTGFDVGIITGDVSIKPEAPCLIMTTEILRSMLYKGADIIRELEWVIFDEVHYVNDMERGVVWEECIIMLPPHVNLVLLSATVPNVLEFADWVGRTKGRPMHVISTKKRPVPLEHHLFYSGEIYKICEGDTYLPAGYALAKQAHKEKLARKSGAKPSTQQQQGPAAAGRGNFIVAAGRGNLAGAGRGGSNKQPIVKTAAQRQDKFRNAQAPDPLRAERTAWVQLMERLQRDSLLPAVVFAFSKKRVDASADGLSGQDYTSTEEKKAIHMFCERAFGRLKGSDQRLPQILRVRELLKRGVGVHHAGLLPIVKEVVEMLFCEGLLRVLFATETFAMGVNAPARTVVFHGLQKHDGHEFRSLLPGEYTQMAGRAGRRGIDTVGMVVVMCWDDLVSEADIKNLLMGKATRLESRFRLTYNTILNLFKKEELTVEDMLKRSFLEVHSRRALPEQQKKLEVLAVEAQKLQPITCACGDSASIMSYYQKTKQADALTASLHDTVLVARGSKALVPGRVFVLKSSAHVTTLAVVLKALKGIYRALVLGVVDLPARMPAATIADNSNGFVVMNKKDDLDDDYVVSKSKRADDAEDNLPVPRSGEAAGVSYSVLDVATMDIVYICQARIKPSPVATGVQQLHAVLQEFPAGFPPALDPVKDMKINDIETVEAYHRLNDALAAMAASGCHTCPHLPEHLAEAGHQASLRDEVALLNRAIDGNDLYHLPDFQRRERVLEALGYIDPDRAVLLKGRVACEMNTGDELLCTEMLLDNQLGELTAEEAVALLSTFVFQEKDASQPRLSDRLSDACERLWSTALHLGDVQQQYGLDLHPEDYAGGVLKFGLVEVVYAWAQGVPFADICELTNVSEGSIVRTIMRLDETCREFAQAAQLIGNEPLVEKMRAASEKIKRDIVVWQHRWSGGFTVRLDS